MTLSASTADAATEGRFRDHAAAQHLSPLWEITTLHQTGEPQPPPPCHWRWTQVQPLIDSAVKETSMRNAERRVLLLSVPAFAQNPNAPRVTAALQAGIQTLMPGESARPHRHTPNALRFVLEDGGETYTLVDGKPCRMERGDIILTPAYTWHGHYNEGTARSVWVDVLDSQLDGYFDAAFFEPAALMPHDMPRVVADAAFAESGMAPLLPAGVSHTHSPRFRFPWQSTLTALAAAPALEDGSRWLRLANPATDGLAMPHMDCRLARLTRETTHAMRSTAGAVCIAASGCGVSRFGDHEMKWRANDVFTLPHWTWTQHRAESDDAVLFIVSDREVLQRLGLLREEQA